VQTFTTITRHRDIWIPKDLVNQIIHSWFFKFTVAGSTAKCSWTFDFLLQKIPNVYVKITSHVSRVDLKNNISTRTDTAIFSTNEAAWNATALDFFAGIAGDITTVITRRRSDAFVQSAVE
jgi:hypothetical protein